MFVPESKYIAMYTIWAKCQLDEVKYVFQPQIEVYNTTTDFTNFGDQLKHRNLQLPWCANLWQALKVFDFSTLVEKIINKMQGWK